MTAYCTESDIRKDSPFKDTVNITPAYVASKIADATNIIDATIGGIYVLPLSAVPSIIASLAKEITTLLLFRAQNKNIEVAPGVSVEAAWGVQMGLLKAISTRAQKLFDPTTNQELPLNTSALPNGYPNAASSVNVTAPRFTMAQSAIFSGGQAF